MKIKFSFPCVITLLLVLLSLLILGPSLFNPSILFAQDIFQINNVGTSAGSIGIGNIEGFSSSAESILENPAALSAISNFSLSGFYSEFLGGDLKFNTLSAAYRTPFGVLGIGTIKFGLNDIPFTGLNPFSEIIELSQFSYSNQWTKISLQNSPSKDFSFGFSLVNYSTSIHTVSGTGWNADAGILLTFPKLSISLSAKNIIPGMKMAYSNGSKENLPLQIVSGVNYRVSDLNVFGQLKSAWATPKFMKSFGIKYQPEYLGRIFYLSGGLEDYSVFDQLKTKFSIGTGLELGPINCHFAYQPSEFFEQKNQYFFSASLDFSSPL